MRIRTLLSWTSYSSYAMVLLMVLALGYSSLATRKANSELFLANAIRETLLEQAMLRDDFINRREARAGEQLSSKSRVLEGQIEEAERAYGGREEADILKEMARESASKAAINELLLANLRASPAAGDARGVAEAYRRMLVGQLLIKSYLLNDDSSRLIEGRLAYLSSVKNGCDWLLAAALTIFAALVLYNGSSIDRILSRGIHGLLVGASSIGQGDLDYRLAVDSDDEVAEVAIEINRMASALRGSFTSISGLEERVSRRTAELDASNTELEAFAYSVAHDLRSPLRAIAGFSRLLEEDLGGELSEERIRLLAVIRDNAHRMDELITSLLEVSRLGHTELRLSPIDMRAMAGEAFRRAADPAALFRFDLGGIPDAEVDPVMIERVWSNLLGNAVKYSMPSATRWIEVGGVEEAGMRVYFVRDHGVGFDPLYADKLFGLFQRLHHESEFPGTGVGLAIVQRLVRRHGGTVWAEGELGVGATFYFSLPARS